MKFPSWSSTHIITLQLSFLDVLPYLSIIFNIIGAIYSLSPLKQLNHFPTINKFVCAYPTHKAINKGITQLFLFYFPKKVAIEFVFDFHSKVFKTKLIY